MKKQKAVKEIIFAAREAEEGGFWAQAIGFSIFTQGETWEELKKMVKDAVLCHFGSHAKSPQLIRLHFVRDEVLAT